MSSAGTEQQIKMVLRVRRRCFNSTWKHVDMLNSIGLIVSEAQLITHLLMHQAAQFGLLASKKLIFKNKILCNYEWFPLRLKPSLQNQTCSCQKTC